MDAERKEEEAKIAAAVDEILGRPSKLDLACADVVMRAVDSILADFGIKGDSTLQQMEAKHLYLQEINWNKEQKRAVWFGEDNSQLSGLYLYQGEDEDAEPIAFISLPFLNRDGRVSVRITRWYRQDRVDDVDARPTQEYTEQNTDPILWGKEE